MKNNFFLSLVLVASLGLLGCADGNGFKSNIPLDGNNEGSSTTPPETVDSWQKISDFQGLVSGGAYDQSLVIYIDKNTQSILLVLPIPVLIPSVTGIEIPDLPGARLTSYRNPDGSHSLAVSIPLTYIARGAVFLPNQRLPSGDPLPYVPSGELPGFGIQFPQKPDYRLNVYVGVSVAAVFIELPDFGLPFGWLTRVKNRDGTKEVGAIGYIPEKGTYAGGMYLATHLPPELARLIDEVLRW